MRDTVKKIIYGNDADKFPSAETGTLFIAIDTPKLYLYGLDGKPITYHGDQLPEVPTFEEYIVEDLPTDASKGDRAYVTDAATPTYLAEPVGEGNVTVPVFFDGDKWIIA